MNSERYFDAKTFLENQVRSLVAPADLPQEDCDEILSLLDNGSGNNNKTGLALQRVLRRVNNTKKQYLQQIFTQQATRHVALQILESESSAQTRALDQTSSVLDLVQSDDEDIDNNDAEADEQDIEQQLRDRLRVQFALMPESKLLSLSQDFLDGNDSGSKDPTGGVSKELQDARDQYEIAKQQHALYKRVHESVLDTITLDPQQAVQPHLLHPRPDLLNLIGRIRSLSARVGAKATYNSENTRDLLVSIQGFDEEDDEGRPRKVEPDPKRQKLIVNNDPSDLLRLIFDGSSSSVGQHNAAA